MSKSRAKSTTTEAKSTTTEEPTEQCGASAIALAIEPTREGYAKAIHTTCRRNAVMVGQLLIAAKDRLKHGEFEAMIEEDLPFGRRTAERLMVVARNEVLSNATHASLLPGTWTVLHELALVDKQLEAGTLEAWVKRGIIHPGIKREEVERPVEHELELKAEGEGRDAEGGDAAHDDYVEYLCALKSKDEVFNALRRLCVVINRVFAFRLSVERTDERAEEPETGGATIN